MTGWWEDPAVREYIRKIAAYNTTEEIEAEAEDDDTKRELYEEAMADSATALDALIIDARRILETLRGMLEERTEG